MWHREIAEVPKVVIQLSDLNVNETVPADFDWRNDMTTYPLTTSTTVETKNWVPEQLLNTSQSPLSGERAGYKV